MPRGCGAVLGERCERFELVAATPPNDGNGSGRQDEGYRKSLLEPHRELSRERMSAEPDTGRLDPRRLVFVDETWAKNIITPIRGWAPRGAKLVGWTPFGHWGTLTFPAALRHGRIDAPCVLDGPINGKLLSDLEAHWPTTRCLPARGIRQLLQELRLCFIVNENDSSCSEARREAHPVSQL